MDDVFDISKFNIFQDEENYYLFRALNRGDHSDMVNAITKVEGVLQKVRTDRERYVEENGEAKYSENSEISLTEMWEHIRIGQSKQTNCISLSGNTNVSVDYGQGYNEEYTVIRAPKNSDKIFNAGQYMLREIEKAINRELEKLPQDSKIREKINSIDKCTNSRSVVGILSTSYEKAKSSRGKYINQSGNLASKKSVSSRFDRKQYFDEAQQLEYDKILAKLTVLETNGILRNIIPISKDNASLIATIGSAFSSGEIIHYKAIEKDELIPISKEMMNVLSLVQQLREKGNTNNTLERNVLEIIRSGNEPESLRQINFEKIKKRDIPVDEVYRLTGGRVNYEKARIAVEFAKKIAESRQKANTYAEIIRELSESQEIEQKVREECFVVDRAIISRENGLGLKIAESVSIGLDKEETRYLKNPEVLGIVSKVQRLSTEELEEIAQTDEIGKELIEEILEKQEEISENQYFAEVIIDGINQSDIYKGAKTITDEERERLVKILENVDNKRLYDAFKNAEIEHKDISGYIVNLMMNNGYKDSNLEEFSKLENLDEIVNINTKNGNLKSKVQAYRFDKLLGIEDNVHVQGTDIVLRDYQQDTRENIDELYEDRRFASLVLPTGGGKSFVAITEMQNFKNKNIVFVAPQVTILNQFQKHIIKNVLKRDNVDVKDYKKVVEEAFPHLKMFCYDTISDKDTQWLEGLDADLIVLDEAHRAGAPTWKPKVQAMMEHNPNAKMLAMTATPIRDVDEVDMLSELARMSGDYTEHEIVQGKHLASNMDVLDAMRDGIVVSPRIVTFDYTLDQSLQYQEIKKMIKEETDPEKKAELLKIHKEMNDIIKKSKKEGIQKIIADNITKKDGRYIVFLPQNTTGKTTEEYFKEEMDKVKEYFSFVDSDPEMMFLSSEKSKKDNIDAIDKFEKSDSKHVKLIFAINMLNEGVHIDGIDGEIMLRPINENSKILYTQQIGRCIHSQDPNNPVPEDKAPIIFDVYNNYLAQDMDRQANKRNQTSDLERFRRISKWIDLHGYFPDINSENISEARKAIVLKNIQTRYKKYLEDTDFSHLNDKEIYEIQEIISLGRNIDLWSIEIPDRVILPGEPDISRNNTFKVTGTQKKFIELFKNAKKLTRDSRKISENIRLPEIIKVLEVLNENGLDINNETILEDSTLRDVLLKLPPEVRGYVLEDIDTDLDYKIGEEYDYAKEVLTGYKFKNKEQYDVRQLWKIGIFEKERKWDYKKLKGEFVSDGPYARLNVVTGTYYDEQGYNIKGLDRNGFNREKEFVGKRYEIYTNSRRQKVIGQAVDTITGQWDYRDFNADEIHKITGTKLNENQCDIRGIYYERQPDGTYISTGIQKEKPATEYIEGPEHTGKTPPEKTYSDFENGIHKVTGTEYDSHDFDVYGIHKNTGTKLNERNFDKNGNFYIINEDGTLTNTGLKYSTIDGRNIDKLDENGFDEEHNYWEKDKEGRLICLGKYDRRSGEDKVIGESNSDGSNVKDEDEFGFKEGEDISSYGFDKEGNWHKKDENGNYVKTGLKYNKQGFRANKTHVITGNRIDLREFDIDGKCVRNNGLPYDKNHFNQDGYYCIVKKDGSYEVTDEKYHNGYNCYDVDENGLRRNGKKDWRIDFTEKYVKAIIQGQRKAILPQLIKEFKIAGKGAASQALIEQKINIALYQASEMYPPLKQEIAKQILNYRLSLKTKERKRQQINLKTKEGMKEYLSIKKQEQILNQRINALDPIQKQEREER